MRAFLGLLAFFNSGAAKTTQITDFGAVPGTGVNASTAMMNGEALYWALKRAAPGDVVSVPAGQRFEFIPYATLVNISRVELRVDGCLAGYDAYARKEKYEHVWPKTGGVFRSLLGIRRSRHVTISGAGALDGRGHGWWVAFALGDLESKRPVNIDIDGSSDVVIRDITVLDSPRFNIYFGTFSSRVLVERVTVLCDWEAQTAIMDAQQRLALPMFPFNTDGVDVSGRDILIRDSIVENWDDVVAVKPADTIDDEGNANNLGCTSNVTVRNLTVYRGAGLSVGSVHPSLNKPCVRDVLFEQVALYSPLKGPYVKPDLGSSDCDHQTREDCSALIQNVTYSDIKMYRSPEGFLTPPDWTSIEAHARAKALLGKDARAVARITSRAPVGRPEFACNAKNYFCMEWPLFVGTQQQLEPDGSGSGIWAATEPRVDVRGVTFKDVKAHGGTWPMSAGVVRCNATNPCAGLVFEDVVLDADAYVRGRRYVCDIKRGAGGTSDDASDPDPSHCLESDWRRG